jgi:hypothetical protein
MAQAVEWLGGAKVAPIWRGAVSTPVRHVLVVTEGFYGNVSAVVLRAPSH